MRKKARTRNVRSTVLASTISALLGSAGVSGLALAQQQPTEPGEPEAATALEEITVTGSRIVRRDFTSSSPIVTVENEDFTTRTGLNLESYLNQLPNFNPAASPTTTQQDVQISAVNSVGVASISLRGFGPNRNLVLVNGRRPTPINALMVTDINGVPSSMIERVEIITGGASAVYGADAVGGVTNFILRDNFEGFEFDMQGGITEAGDGEEMRIHTLIGANLDNGRGNVVFGAEYYDRSEALERRRDFFTDAWADPTVGSGNLFVFGFNGYNTGPATPEIMDPVMGPQPNAPGTAAMDTIFADRPDGTGYISPFTSAQAGFRFNPDGSMFTLTGDNLWKFSAPERIDGREYALQTVYDGTRPGEGVEIDTLKWNNLDALASAPQDRYSLFASGHYDVTDSVRFFARANWAESNTRTFLLPANASFGWEANMPYDPETDSPVDPTLDYSDPAVVADVLANPEAYANPGFIATGEPGAQHPVPLEFAVMLNSRPIQDGTWIMETYPATSFDQRQTTNTNAVWQVEAGVEFDLPLRDWTGEVYVSHGESSTYNLAGGNNSLSRWRAMVTSPDYGRGVTLEGNQPPDSSNPGFGAAVVTCESGFYDTIFLDDAPPSDDCSFAVEAPLQSRTQNQQDIVELNFQGGIMDLPAGELRGAAGFQYRENAAQFFPDILQSTASFTDQVIGVYPTAYMDASTNVNDFYTELLVPVLPNFELELGARYSDYKHSSNEWTYKALGTLQIGDNMRFRGGYNRATRAPNLGELFLNTQEIFTGGGNFGDPCHPLSNSPFGAAGAEAIDNTGGPESVLASGQTQEGAESTYLICQAQMAEAAAAYYGQTYQFGGGADPFAWVLQEGNPDLDSEKADTWTLGMVLTSPSDNPWLSGLSASLDWWRVTINDAIQQYSIDYGRWLCYEGEIVSTPEEAAARAASPECQNVNRSTATGDPTTILLQYDNQATIQTSGVDVAVNWFAQLQDIGLNLPGGIGFNTQMTWLDYYRTTQSPLDVDVEIDWAGSLGPTLSGTNAGAYRYRLFSSINWFSERTSVNLRWRFLPSVWGAGYASQQAIIRNNERVAAGGDGMILSYTPTTAIKAGSYSVFDLSFTYNLNDQVSFRGGIDNLFDKSPSVTGASTGRPTGSDLDICGDAPGCQNPTDFSLPSTGAGQTNTGFYDTLGRRFFVGVRLRM